MENEPSNSSSTSIDLKVNTFFEIFSKLFYLKKLLNIFVFKQKSRTKNSGAGASGGRKEDSIRKHFFKVITGTKKNLKCNLCKNEVSNKARRLRKHFEKCIKKQEEKENIVDSESSGLEIEDSNNPVLAKSVGILMFKYKFNNKNNKN